MIQIAYLSGNWVKDLEYLPSLSTLRKLDLSHNEINSIPSPQALEGLKSLKILYFHDNGLSDWTSLKALIAIPGIMHLTLFNNPVVTIPGYRHFLTNSSTSLLALDNYLVTDEERLEDACFGYRFRSMNEFMKLHLPEFPTHKTAA